MNKISRRKFIVRTGGTLGLLQMDVLAKGAAAIDLHVDPKADPKGWHHITKSGANLYFHLINGHPRCGELVPIDDSLPSYLVVQLPGQSLHEQYYYTNPDKPGDVPDRPLRAMLSGPTFLAFALWNGLTGTGRRMPFTVEALLEWENSTHFRLLTIEDIPANPSDLAQTGDFWPQLDGKCDYQKLRPDPKTLGTNGLYDLDYYKDLTQKVLNDHPGRFLTIFELPAGIITAPISSIRSDGLSSDLRWTPVVRQNLATCGVKTIYETRYSFSKKGKHFTREVRERWNAEIKFLAPAQMETPSFTSIHSLPPALRIICLLNRGGLGDDPCAHPTLRPPTLRIIGPLNGDGLGDDPCADPTPRPFENPGYLPTLLDEAELLYLNQLGKKCFRSEAFDLKVSGPFLLTALGATLKFHYKNYNTKGLGDQSISLVEYEHHFQDGRDNFIKVSRIGLVCPSGQKALHVIIAQRKIDQGSSFLEYKEYVEFIEKEKDYSPSAKTDAVRWEDTPYFCFEAPKDDKAPWQADFRYPNALPFKKSEILERRTPNMQPVGVSLNSFWVYHELPGGAGSIGTSADLIQVPVQYHDQNGNKVEKVSFHPILFMARSFFCGTAGKTWIDGNDPTSLQNNQDQRIRIPLNGQIVAFTPDDPEPISVGEPPTVPNKTNQLATEWCDYVINVAQPSTTADSIFDTAKHPIYPRVRRAKALLDHLQQYGGKKLPSIITYDPLYLQLGLPGQNPTRPLQNTFKFVLRHASDFTGKGLVDLNNAALSLNKNLWDADLNDGWGNITKTFRNAGAQLGGMVNPDPLLQRISFSPSALSLPDGPLDPKALDPQAIFPNADAELFCGIRLKDILAMLDIENLPQYLLFKLPDDFSDPQKALAAIGGNPFIQKVLQGIETTAQIISDLQAKVIKDKADLATNQEDFNRIGDDLKNQLPDYNKLLGVSQLQFRAAQSAYRADLAASSRPLLMAFESMKALQDLGLNDARQSVVDFLSNYVKSLFLKPDGSINDEYTNSWTGLELANQLADLKTDLDNQTGDALTWATSTDLIFQGQWPTKEKMAQALLNLITQNVSLRDSANKTAADRFFHRTALLTKLFELVKNRLPNDGPPPTVRDKWELGLRQVDLLRRTAEDYYTQEREQTEQELKGILRNAKLEIANERGRLNDLVKSGADYTGDLVEQCNTNGIISAVQFASNPQNICARLNTARDAFKAELLAAAQSSPLYKELGEKLNDFERLRGVVNTAKQSLASAESQLTAQAQQRAGTLLAQLDKNFNDQIASLNNVQDIQEARAAYDKLTQLLTALKRQELSLDWKTENFKPVDLGFVRFDPGSSPGARLEMKVRASMEMDPLRFPPVVQSTEVKTETRLTDFSIMFFNMIGVRFSHVSFVAGTKTSTDLDIKISDVTFGGGLSFIQLLQSLLNGLADGLRMELGATQVAIGFQTPTIDISSPGFTFSNFSVGMLLVIHFDRQPLQLTFELATAEKKATIAAGIYGGCFYCAMTLEPKRGVVAIEMAMEMGAYIGIRFGPFKGYVKFMAGLFYKKDDQGVVLEGYLVAEGLLSVWVISVCARLYMGVRSQNSYVEGFCVASYSVKVGFLEKTFTATYSKSVSGAASNEPSPSSVAVVLQKFSADTNLWRVGPVNDAGLSGNRTRGGTVSENVEIKDLFLNEDRAMNEQEFMEYASIFFSTTE